MQDNVNYNIKRKCRACCSIFQSSALDDEIYCNNCREDEDILDVYPSSKDWDDIVSTSCNTDQLGEGSCRTSPVFYD